MYQKSCPVLPVVQYYSNDDIAIYDVHHSGNTRSVSDNTDNLCVQTCVEESLRCHSDMKEHRSLTVTGKYIKEKLSVRLVRHLSLCD